MDAHKLHNTLLVCCGKTPFHQIESSVNQIMISKQHEPKSTTSGLLWLAWPLLTLPAPTWEGNEACREMLQLLENYDKLTQKKENHIKSPQISTAQQCCYFSLIGGKVWPDLARNKFETRKARIWGLPQTTHARPTEALSFWTFEQRERGSFLEHISAVIVSQVLRRKRAHKNGSLSWKEKGLFLSCPPDQKVWARGPRGFGTCPRGYESYLHNLLAFSFSLSLSRHVVWRALILELLGAASNLLLVQKAALLLQGGLLKKNDLFVDNLGIYFNDLFQYITGNSLLDHKKKSAIFRY